MKTNTLLRAWAARLLWTAWLGPLLGAAPVRAEPASLDEAVAAYESFEYQKALDLLQRIERRGDLPATQRARVQLYIGLVRFTLGDRQQAERDFARAIEADPDIAAPEDTSPKIVEVIERVRQRVAPPEPPPDGPPLDRPPPDAAPEPARGRVWTWVAAGVGAAALAGGGVLGGLALQKKSAFEDEVWADRAADLRAQAEDFSLGANVMFGVGGALLVTAVVLFFVEDDGSGGERAGVEVGVAPQLRGLRAGIRF
jgi:tetratricopeptide (TPR) repeat protein